MDYSSAFSYKSIYSYDKKTYTGDAAQDLLERERFAAVNSSSRESFQIGSIISALATIVCYVFVVITFPIGFVFYLKRVKPFEKAVIFRLGKVRSAEGPGVVFVLPFLDRCTIVSLKESDIKVSCQQFLSNDNAVVQCGAHIRFRISDPVRYSTSYYDPGLKGLESLVKSILLRVGGAHEEGDFFPDSNGVDSLSELVSKEISRQVNMWGIEIVTTFIVDRAVIKPAENKENGFMKALFGQSGTDVPQSSNQSLMANLMNFHQGPPSPVLPANGETSKKSSPAVSNGSAVRWRVEEALAKAPPSYPSGSERVVLRLEVAQDGRIVEQLFVNLTERMLVGPENHQISVKGDEETIMGLLNGTVSPSSAYFTSLIHVDGDMKLLKNFTDLL